MDKIRIEYENGEDEELTQEEYDDRVVENSEWISMDRDDVKYITYINNNKITTERFGGPEWDRLADQLRIMEAGLHEIIDNKENHIKDEDIWDFEVYISETGNLRKWTGSFGGKFVDVYTPREDKYIDNSTGKTVETEEIVRALELPMRISLEKHFSGNV